MDQSGLLAHNIGLAPGFPAKIGRFLPAQYGWKFPALTLLILILSFRRICFIKAEDKLDICFMCHQLFPLTFCLTMCSACADLYFSASG